MQTVQQVHEKSTGTTQTETTKPELNLREKIVQLRFSFGCSVHRDFAIHEEWMKNASQCGIEKFHLEIDVYGLPICLISCESIEELPLCKRNNGVKLPQITLASLETLIMDSVQVTMSLGLWLSKYSPSLKCLRLKNITTYKPLDISISSLENVMISDDYICDIKIKTEKLRSLEFSSGSWTHYYKSKERKVQIKAPNLQILRWKGVPRRFSCQEELRALQRAIINAEEWRKDSKANVNCARLVELLQTVRWAGHLHLDSWILKVLLKIPPILFENLFHLSLRLEREDAHYIIPFLEKFGDINSLCMEESHVASYREHWGGSSSSSADGYHQFQGNSFVASDPCFELQV